jgi:L-threonylcarbamoyladenylate synthase
MVLPSLEIRDASERLKQGQLVAFATETVYGLGADASNSEALHRLFTVKGRPENHPVIVHLHNAEVVEQWATAIPETAQILMQQFWPGPLTLILPKQAHVLLKVTGGQDTVGLRVPDHPQALALLKEFHGGIAAPSANRHGHISPTQSCHVRTSLQDDSILVLEGGTCPVGIESTIVGFNPDGHPHILRPGMLNSTMLAACLDLDASALFDSLMNPETTRVSGGLASHYAPRKPCKNISEKDILSEVSNCLALGQAVGVMSFQGKPVEFENKSNLLWLQCSKHAIGYAQELYTYLHQLDAGPVDIILLEAPPSDLSWQGIQDRVKRATTSIEKKTGDSSQ